MKNGSKFKKITPVLALTLPLVLSAVLGAFTSFKTAKADYPPVYNQESTTNSLTDTPFSLYEVSVIRGVSTEFGASTDGYGVYTFDSPRYSLTDEGQVSITHTIDEIAIHGRVTYDMQTPQTMRLRAFFDSSEINLGGYEAVQLNTYRPFYANEGLYNRLVKSINAPLRVSSVGEYATSLRISYTINYDCMTLDGLTPRMRSNQTRVTVGTSFNVTGFLPTYTALLEDTIEDDYIYIRSVSLTYQLIYENYAPVTNSRIQLTASGASPVDISYTGYVDTQNNAKNFFYTRNVRQVDEIGLSVISHAVSEFLNTEFIPGFKLWYFLLIGLGVMITGMALKFFLGG